MKNLYNYTNKTGYVLAQQVNLLWRFVMVMLVLFVITGTTVFAQDPGVGGTKAGFEIDADFKSGFIPTFWTNSNYSPNRTTLGDDWSQGLTGKAVLKQSSTGVSVPGKSEMTGALWQVDGNSGSNSVLAEGSTFSGTSNKNGDNIATGQNPYLIQLGGSTPQKNDITNTYLYGKEEVVGTTKNLWLFYGAETRSVNGASYVDFEYNQAGVKVVPNGTQFNLVGNGSVGGRTIGDILLVINYTGGGNKPVVGIRTWETGAKWSAEKTLPTGAAFVTTNTADVASVAPNMSFTGDGAYSNITGALQFVEGGVNITALNIPSFNPCNPASTVTVKTRSSPSYTSELKDYDILNFTALPPSTMTALADVTICPGATAVFSTTVTGNGALASNVQWFLGTSTTPITNGGKYAITTDGFKSILTITGVTTSEAGKYTAKLTNATCGNPETSANLILNPVPEVNAGTDPAAQCYIEAGNSFSLKGSGANGTALWTVFSNPNNLKVAITGETTFEPTVSVTGVGTVTLRLTVTSSFTPSCGAKSDDVDVTVSPKPGPPATKYNAPLCDEATFSVEVLGPEIGAIYTIVNASDGGNKVEIKAEDDGTGKAKAVKFTGRIPGTGYSVTATLGKCVTEADVCGAPKVTAIKAVLPSKASEITELAKSNEMTAYPIPFSEKTTLEFKSIKSEDYVINLYDLKGNLVKQLKAGNARAGEITKVEVDGRGMAESMYFVRKVGKTGVSTLKLLKKD